MSETSSRSCQRVSDQSHLSTTLAEGHRFDRAAGAEPAPGAGRREAQLGIARQVMRPDLSMGALIGSRRLPVAPRLGNIRGSIRHL